MREGKRLHLTVASLCVATGVRKSGENRQTADVAPWCGLHFRAPW